jgi:hypothetical protein
MSVTITAAQRDALCDQIFDRLSGIEDIELAVRAGRPETAERLAREYTDDLRLLVNDLGLGVGDAETIELTSPPRVLRRALIRLRDLAVGHASGLESEFDEIQQIRVRGHLIAEACASVLDRLDGAAEIADQGC